MLRPNPVLLATLLPTAALAQGQVNFNNYVPAATPRVDAPATWGFGERIAMGAIPGMKAQLCLIGDLGKRIPVGDITTFRSSPPAAQPYLNGITVVVPGVEPDQAATFVIRFWLGEFYGQWYPYGEFAPLTITLGGGTSVPADLTGLQPYWNACLSGGTASPEDLVGLTPQEISAIICPEPPILAIVVAGGVFLLAKGGRNGWKQGSLEI